MTEEGYEDDDDDDDDGEKEDGERKGEKGDDLFVEISKSFSSSSSHHFSTHSCWKQNWVTCHSQHYFGHHRRFVCVTAYVK